MKFVYIKRRCIQFTDGLEVSYSCSCNKDEESLLDGLDDKVDISVQVHFVESVRKVEKTRSTEDKCSDMPCYYADTTILWDDLPRVFAKISKKVYNFLNLKNVSQTVPRNYFSYTLPKHSTTELLRVNTSCLDSDLDLRLDKGCSVVFGGKTEGLNEPVNYYNNSCASFHLELEGDLVFKLNPGPETKPEVHSPRQPCHSPLTSLLGTKSHPKPISAIPVLITNKYTNPFHLNPRFSPPVRNPSNLINIKRDPMLVNSCSGNARLCLLNARPVKSKSFIIKDFVVDNNIDILAITETWLKDDINDQLTVNDICPSGFFYITCPVLGEGVVE
ncbi:predicted protein [Nematostella vectensis]|uniref:Uncharacterized protein n=1 Tax=Nematostella vectensis TaxID=45351 RepID=A7SVG2_NEMVE|nr:predicted protein [Nematostella vectensis]|eukprot:XP_001624404.1 predicted protein [Nematostella vectensis]